MSFIIGKGVQLVASGIGLASEGITHHKEKKRAKSQGVGESSDDPQSPHLEDEDEVPRKAFDEEHWDLDDAQQDLTSESSPSQELATPQEIKQTVAAFISRHPPPPPSYDHEPPKLQFPVVLPQRRPKDKSRGFIRAYAPSLEEVGIDQAMFIDFIETFDKSTQVSPWVSAINLANFATLAMAPPFSILVSVAISQAVNIISEVQVRASTNNFLTKINNEFFRPRGLFCLVMTWNPESPYHTTEVNVTSNVSSSMNHSKSAMGKVKHAMQSSNGNTYGELEFPEVAPLIFPALDDLAGQTGEEAQRKRDKIKKAKGFADDYMDRRAVAKYAARNPNSVLAETPKPKFTSRYADPTHPASSGNLISLLSGGHINPPQIGPFALGGGIGGGEYGTGFGGRPMGVNGGGRGALGRGFGFGGGRVDNAGAMRKGENYGRGGFGSGFGRGGGGFGGVDGSGLMGLNPIVGIKKLLKKQVLYLMIVNMPSDEELAAATQHLNQQH